MRRAAPLVIALALPLAASCEGRPASSGAGTGASAPPPLTAAEAREAFCSIVFDRAKVGEIVGIGRLHRIASTRPVEPGVGECIHDADGDATVALVTDCRPEHPRLEPTRASLTGLPGFRAVDVGIGGFYVNDPDEHLHRLVFLTERPSCAVYVSTTGVVSDTTEALARHVAALIATRQAP